MNRLVDRYNLDYCDSVVSEEDILFLVGLTKGFPDIFKIFYGGNKGKYSILMRGVKWFL